VIQYVDLFAFIFLSIFGPRFYILVLACFAHELIHLLCRCDCSFVVTLNHLPTLFRPLNWMRALYYRLSSHTLQNHWYWTAVFVLHYHCITVFSVLLSTVYTYKKTDMCLFTSLNFLVLVMYSAVTHCCAWPAEGRSDVHSEWPWLVIWVRPTDILQSCSTCCSHVLLWRPGGCFQSAAGGGGVPVSTSVDSCNACEAFSSSMCKIYEVKF